MGFDVRTSFNNASFSGAQAREQPLLVAELALWSAMSDGVLEPREIDAIAATIAQIPALADFTPESALKTTMVFEANGEAASASRMRPICMSRKEM